MIFLAFHDAVILWGKIASISFGLNRATEMWQKTQKKKMTTIVANNEKNIWLMHTCQGEQKIENLSYVCTMYMVQETMLYSMTKSNWQNNEPPCPKKEIMNEKKKKQERVEKERWIVLHIILLVA